MNEQDISKIKEALQRTRKICVVFHFNPDGDAIGCALALYHYFKEDGYEMSVVSPNAFPDFLNWMEGSDRIVVAQDDLVKARKAIKEADMLYVVDMNAPHRAGQDLQNSISKSKAFKVLIDHHVQPEINCDVMYTTHLTSSASELVFNFLYRFMTPERPVAKAIAEALYVGIITDTGSMSYACDYPGTYEVLGKLIASGINGEGIHQKVYSNYTESRLRLMGVALTHLKIMPEYGASYMYLTRQELIDNHFQIGDSEGFVNYGMTIKGVEFTAFFMERESRIRVSFRSKGKVDVNRFARDHYNGGGHHNAAGAFFDGTVEEAVAHFEKVVREGKY